MSITSITTDFAGETGVRPRIVRVQSTDSFATVTTQNYLKPAIQSFGFTFYQDDIVAVSYDTNTSQFFTLNMSGGNITLVPQAGSVTLPVVSGDVPAFTGTSGAITDSGIAASNIMLKTSTAGQTSTTAVTSATPGTIRSITGKTTETATTMTSGNIVGVRGEVDCVGASGGFIYGAQGKVIATGSFSGSVWTAAVFAQFDLSAATMSTAQFAPVWADYGTTITSGTYAGARMYAGTNTTAAILNSQIYLFGGATNLLELSDNSGGVGPTYITTPAGSTPSGDLRTLTVSINGGTYKILAAATYS